MSEQNSSDEFKLDIAKIHFIVSVQLFSRYMILS